MKRPPEKRRAHDGWWQTGPMYRGHGLPGMWRNVHGADMSRLAYRIGERVYCRGLWAYPYHETTYAFGKPGIAAFTAEVAFAPKLRRGRADRSVAVNFEIYVDGTLRTQSGLMRAGDEPRLLAVDGLADAETLRLVTRRQDGVNDLRMLTVWADPTFYAPQPPAHLAALYEASRQLLTDPPGTPVRRWAVLGPFDPGGKRFSVYHREGIERDPYLGGKELDFSATHDGKDGRKLRWRAVETGEDGMMDLAKALGGEAEETVSYACATIESDRDRPIQLGVGACSPDHHNAFHVWLNGKTLHGQGGTGRKPNAVRVVGRLKKGRNLLIVRLIEVMRTKDPALIVTYRADGVTVRPPEGVDRR